MSEKSVKERARHRAKIIRGQMDGVVKMLENEEYCIDILTQSLAIQKSLQSLNNFILENHLNTCATTQIKKGKKNKAIEEIMKVYKLTQKS